MKADLHIHSCLSPCSTLYMSPSKIVEMAVKKGLDLIAISDHNTAKNNIALNDLCSSNKNINCLFGIEISTREEIHVLAYFDDLDVILDLDSWIYSHLPNIQNQIELQGYQVMVDTQENVLEQIDRSLINATDICLSDLITKIHDMKGLVIPAHIDRPSFSLSSQLGFIPDEDFDALELTRHSYQETIAINRLKGFPIITGSDAHSLLEVGSNTFEYISPISSIYSLVKYLNE